MPFLSIIVPIYNIEKYLPQCIDSILEQSFKDYELILVNDGSPDSCSDICVKYEEMDNRIKVIHKKNGGLSDARNAGIDIAEGKYLIFVDGDDYMKDFGLEKIMQALKGNEVIDMLICPLIKKFPTEKEIIDYLPIQGKSQLLNQDEMLESMVISKTTFWGAGKNIYLKSIIDKNKLRFKYNLIGAEDCEFFMRYIRLCKSFYLINIPVINYRLEREGSITNVMSASAVMGQLQVFYDNYFVYKFQKQDENVRIQTFFANKFANTISLLPYLPKDIELKKISTYLKSSKIILTNTKGTKYSIAKIFWLSFGYYRGSVLIKKLNRFK
ncbi:glycosyltransferase family A protein [Paenisporosarcina sp. TG20]|uniref:glycosyltransferase family 2 protein n=1 Tax=Paenisporosarcina sp. TG20 TaxID=1211706 RepID=UPI00031CE720|nr:glycosyltransferase family A protein [Paenisporosarcina sp. TG20]